MRVTKKLLIKLVNEKLIELEIGYEVESIERSRFRGQDYENGAYWWKAILKRKDGKPQFIIKPFIYSFMPFSEFEEALNRGLKLTIKNTRYRSNPTLEELEITYH